MKTQTGLTPIRMGTQKYISSKSYDFPELYKALSKMSKYVLTWTEEDILDTALG